MRKIIFSSFILVFFAFSANAKPLQFQPKAMLGDSAKLKDYVGTYKLAEGAPIEFVKFKVEDGDLKAEADGYPAVKLISTGIDTFEETQYNAIFVFSRVNGVVTGFKQSVRGMEMEGTKVVEKK